MLKQTEYGTPYLTEAEVVSIHAASMEVVDTSGIYKFLDELSCREYWDEDDGPLDALQWPVKLAGQLCYMSFGPNRTKNVDAQRYFDHLKEMRDGSVFEHVSAGFIFYGVSRSLTHELVRHRAGFAYSQVSQRYVAKPRFVERPEYQQDNYLHELFEIRIDRTMREYEEMLDHLSSSDTIPVGAIPKTERLKSYRQTARSMLPNETEAPIMVTANVRAWRHFLEMRCSPYAETEIRALALKVYHALLAIYPMFFNDYVVQGDNTLDTPWRKV